MRAAIISIGVLAAGSLLSGSAKAQYDPYSFPAGVYNELGFMQQNQFQVYGNGYGFQGNGDDVNVMGAIGNLGWANQGQAMLPNNRRQIWNNPYGSPSLYRSPRYVLPSQPMQQTQYPQQFPYMQQIQGVQQPQYTPQTQYFQVPGIPHQSQFGMQPMYMLPFPTMLQPLSSH